MRIRVLTVLATLLAATSLAAADAGTKYGAGVTLESSTAIADLVKTPDKFLAAPVRIDGVVAAVCDKAGCWMQIEDPATKAIIRCKVDDGVIVFPVSAKGKKASVQGTLEPIAKDPEMAQHAAAAAKDPKAPVDTHGAPTGAQYHLRTTGAVIY